jgi:hypothetical protein
MQIDGDALAANRDAGGSHTFAPHHPIRFVRPVGDLTLVEV